MFGFNNLSTAFTCFLLILLVFRLYKLTNKGQEWQNREEYTLNCFLLLLLCVFAYYNDYWSLEESIPKLQNDVSYGAGLEKVYIWIAELSCYNYSIWRFLSWGIGVAAMMLIYKNLRINNNYSILVFCCCNYWHFGYARSAIAMAIFTLGFCILIHSKFNAKNILISAIIIGSSFFLHKSQAIAMIGFPLLLVRLNKKTVLISACLLPFAIHMINYAFDHLDTFFNMNSTYYDMEILQSKAERYMEYDKTALFGRMRGFMEFFNELTMYILVVSIVFLMSIKGLQKNANRVTCAMYALMYALVYFALAAALTGFQQSVYSYRIFNMSLIPAALCLLLMYRDGLIKNKTVLILSGICFFGRVLESFVYELYVTFS